MKKQFACPWKPSGLNFWEDLRKKLEVFGFFEKLKSLISDWVWRKKTVKWMIVEKTRDLFIDLPKAEIRGADLELKLSWRVILRRPAFWRHPRPEWSNTTFAFQAKWHPPPKTSSATFASQTQQLGSCLQTPNECRVQRRQSTTVASSSTRASFSLSNTMSMSLFLQSAQ